METTRVYIAAPLFSQKQKDVIFEIYDFLITSSEFECFSPWHASQEIWKGRAPADCTSMERAKVVSGNANNIDWADILLAWVGGTDNGKTDTGVVWEMGYAHKAGTPILAFIHPDDQRREMNLMLSETVDGVVYSMEDMHDALLGFHDHRYVPKKYSLRELPTESAAIATA